MGFLRVRRKGKETTFELAVHRRDVKAKCQEHLRYFGRESVPSGRKDHKGTDILEMKNIPAEEWIFEWVENAGTSQETIEPVGL